jgi:hypothetical protein
MSTGLDETRMKMLGELAEMALVLARDLKEAALVAKTTDEKVRLADAFQKVGRGVRQSLALHAKMERDAQAVERETQAGAAPPTDQIKVRREGRAARIKSEVERLIWTEREKLEEEPYVLRNRLTELLAAEARSETFLDTDPDLQIERLCQALRIPRPIIPTAHPIPDRHPRACPGDPDAPIVQNGPGAAAASPATPASLGPRDKPGDGGAGGGGDFRSSA